MAGFDPTVNRYPNHEMNSGEGLLSYAQNSSVQRNIALYAKEIIEEEITRKLDVQELGPTCKNGFIIADFGCSTGKNSFLAVQYITDSVKNKFQSSSSSFSSKVVPEFLVFFNDLFANDFNTLFSSLPPDRQYLATGLPGDCKERLLPKSSLHFAYSSCTIHWLKKFPEEITDPTSPAWNKGSIHCTGENKKVCEAYANQFANETQLFLEARAQELVAGGMLAFFIPAKPAFRDPATSDTNCVYVYLLNACIVDMANEGRINEALVDSFNIPWYLTTPDDLQTIVERSQSFSIETIETLKNPPPFTASDVRAMTEKMLNDHFGSEITDELFDRYQMKLDASRTSIDPANGSFVIILVVLKRKFK